jgi:hypothetical protein
MNVRDRARRFMAIPRPMRVVGLLLTGLTLWLTIRVFLVFNDPMLHGGVNFDESHFVWGGWCMTKGLVPYRDFLEFKPPFIFITHFVAMKLFGYREFGYRWFFLYFPLVSLLSLQLSMLSRGIDRWLSLAVVLGIIQLWVNHSYHDVALSDTESIGVTYYWFAVAFLLAKTPFKSLTNAIGGGLLVVCTLSKEPFLLVSMGTWVACFLVRERGTNAVRDLKQYWKYTFIGAVVVVAGLCIYMIPTGAMREYIKMAAGYVRLYRDPEHSYCVVLGRFHPTTPSNDLWRSWDKARREFLNRQTLGYLLPLGVGALVFTARRSIALLATTLIIGFFAFYAVTASNCQWFHYYNMTMTGIFFFLVIGLDSMTPYLQSSDWAVRNFIRFSMLASIWIVVRPRFLEERELYGTRTFPNEYPNQVPGELDAINKYTKPTDRIFTTGMPALYVEADRISAVRESAIVDETLGYYEGNTDEEKLSGLRAELDAHMPKLVILDPEWAPRKVRTNKALMMPFLEAHHYQQVGPYFWLRPY